MRTTGDYQGQDGHLHFHHTAPELCDALWSSIQLELMSLAQELCESGGGRPVVVVVICLFVVFCPPPLSLSLSLSLCLHVCCGCMLLRLLTSGTFRDGWLDCAEITLRCVVSRVTMLFYF